MNHQQLPLIIPMFFQGKRFGRAPVAAPLLFSLRLLGGLRSLRGLWCHGKNLGPKTQGRCLYWKYVYSHSEHVLYFVESFLSFSNVLFGNRLMVLADLAVSYLYHPHVRGFSDVPWISILRWLNQQWGYQWLPWFPSTNPDGQCSIKTPVGWWLVRGLY